MTQKTCKIDGCLNLLRAKGLCKKHYQEEYDKQRYLTLKEKLKSDKRKFYSENKEIILKRNLEYRSNNKKKISLINKEYRENNKEYYNSYFRSYVKNRRDNDPEFKLRGRVSNSIFKALKFCSGIKNNKSILNSLPYTIKELKQHLEKQFDFWMTWENHGKYNSKDWNDADQSTWTWQLDHIIPQSTLPYSSMEDDNFKRCWSLENLRPLSAKQNLLDGARK